LRRLRHPQCAGRGQGVRGISAEIELNFRRLLFLFRLLNFWPIFSAKLQDYGTLN
jgi:hypothetical protein